MNSSSRFTDVLGFLTDSTHIPSGFVTEPSYIRMMAVDGWMDGWMDVDIFLINRQRELLTCVCGKVAKRKNNLKKRSWRERNGLSRTGPKQMHPPGALCRISSSVAGLIPGERTSATRSVLQISDRHLRRYPILIAWVRDGASADGRSAHLHMSRTQNSPKRRQEKQVSARRKH